MANPKPSNPDFPQVFKKDGTVKPSLGDVETILDPMLSDNYELLIPKLPKNLSLKGGGDAVKMLRLYCKSATKPAISNEAVDVDLYGHKLKFAGRTTFDNTFTVEFVENRLNQVNGLMADWLELVRSTGYQLGNYKDDYKAVAQLTVVDTMGGTSCVYLIYNIFPTEVPEISFTGEDASVITASVTFSYDWWEMKGKKYAEDHSQASTAAGYANTVQGV